MFGLPRASLCLWRAAAMCRTMPLAHTGNTQTVVVVRSMSKPSFAYLSRPLRKLMELLDNGQRSEAQQFATSAQFRVNDKTTVEVLKDVVQNQENGVQRAVNVLVFLNKVGTPPTMRCVTETMAEILNSLTALNTYRDTKHPMVKETFQRAARQDAHRLQPVVDLLKMMETAERSTFRNACRDVMRLGMRFNAPRIVIQVGAIMAKEKGIPLDARCAEMVTIAHAKERNVKQARLELQSMISRGLQPSAAAFNTIISACARNRFIKDALEVFDSMKATNVKPTLVTYNCLLDALAQREGFSTNCSDLFKHMLTIGVQPDVVTLNTVIKSYCTDKRLDEARNLVKRMRELGFSPSFFTYTTLLHGCSLTRDLQAAYEVFSEMSAVARAASETPVEGSRQHSVKAEKDTPGSSQFDKVVIDLVAMNALLNVCAKVGDTKAAQEVFLDIQHRGLEPNIVTMNTMLHASAVANDGPLFDAIHKDLLSRRMPLSWVTLTLEHQRSTRWNSWLHVPKNKALLNHLDAKEQA